MSKSLTFSFLLNKVYMSQKISDFETISPDEFNGCVNSSNSENPTQFCYAGATFIGNGIVKNVKVNLTDYFYTKDEINFRENNLADSLVPGNILSSKNNKPISTNIKTTDLENHIIDAVATNSSFHVTPEEKNKWSNKQDKLGTIFSDIISLGTNPQLSGKLLYINSKGNIDIYTGVGIEHFSDTSKHITEEERKKWNSCIRMFPDYSEGYTIHWTEDYYEGNYYYGSKNLSVYPELPAKPTSADLSKFIKFHPRWIRLKSGNYQPNIASFVATGTKNLNDKAIYFNEGAADGATYKAQFASEDDYRRKHTRWWKETFNKDGSHKGWEYTGVQSYPYSYGNDLQLYPFYRGGDYLFRSTTDTTSVAYNLHQCIIPPLGKDALYILELWEGEASHNHETYRIDYREPVNVLQPYNKSTNKWKSWSYIGSHNSNDISRLELQIPANGQIKITLFRTDTASCKIIAFPYRYTNE